MIQILLVELEYQMKTLSFKNLFSFGTLMQILCKIQISKMIMIQIHSSELFLNREGVPDRGRADDFCRLLGSVGSNTLQTLRGILLLPRRNYRYEEKAAVCDSLPGWTDRQIF